MRQVTKDQFYAAVGPLNVHPSIQPGSWPYTSLWKLQSGDQRTVGKTVGRLEQPGKAATDYYLATP